MQADTGVMLARSCGATTQEAILGSAALALTQVGASSAGSSGDAAPSALGPTMASSVAAAFKVHLHLLHGVASTVGHEAYSIGEHDEAATAVRPEAEVVERLRLSVNVLSLKNLANTDF